MFLRKDEKDTNMPKLNPMQTLRDIINPTESNLKYNKNCYGFVKIWKGNFLYSKSIKNDSILEFDKSIKQR